MAINRKYKDNLFRMIFGKEENKENLLSLYNAINGTSHTDLDDLTINTLENVIYMSYKNDVSCIVEADDVMSLYEHQSTFNPNMPLRGLIYLARLYDKYYVSNNQMIYSENKIEIPRPKYYVFYIGQKDVPDRTELYLSDLYKGEGDLECKATLININLEHNKDILEKCRSLYEYSFFINMVYSKNKKYDNIELAIGESIDECIDENILKKFLNAHKAEVQDVLLEEFNEKDYHEFLKKEGKKEGIKEGIKEGKIEMIKTLLKTMTPEQIIESGIEKEIVEEAMKEQ